MVQKVLTIEGLLICEIYLKIEGFRYIVQPDTIIENPFNILPQL